MDQGVNWLVTQTPPWSPGNPNRKAHFTEGPCILWDIIEREADGAELLAGSRGGEIGLFLWSSAS